VLADRLAMLVERGLVNYAETRRPEARVFLDGDDAAIQATLRRQHVKGGGR
jgi:hypothetical protein